MLGKAAIKQFHPNSVPSFDEGHLAKVESLQEGLTNLMRVAYPNAYDARGNFVSRGRPALAMKPAKLEAGINQILDEETLAFLLGKEAGNRPVFETQGLGIVF